MSTTGSVTNSGFIGLDIYLEGGSTLSIGGALTNTGTLDIGTFGLSSSNSVTANSFVNSGTVDLTGHGTISPPSTCRERRPTTARFPSSPTPRSSPERSAARGPSASQTANLQFDSSVSAGQTINETGADALTLEQAQNFAATISGFGTGDTIDAANFLLVRNDVQFRREFGGDRRHAHADRHESQSDRQYPDDRRLFELEFHPRPRQRDRHAGEVRLSRRRHPRAGVTRALAPRRRPGGSRGG